MKKIQMHRNIGIIAHIDAGKTTTTERILFYSGRIHKIGETHEGEGTMDWMSQEKERGITITSAATYCQWGDHSINIIDTPGHVDFTIEVERSMRVLDGGVVVLDGSAGVEPQSETVWRQADKYGVPRIIYANKMTKMGADFEMSRETVENMLTKNVVPIQLPVGAEDNFTGIIDLVTMKYNTFSGKFGEVVEESDIPEDYKDAAQNARETLLERVAETDEALMEKYFGGEEITNDEIKAAIRKATINLEMFPMLVGDALSNIGVQKILDAVTDYLPSPTDVPAIEGVDLKSDEPTTREAKDEGPLSAIAFKIATDPFVGKLVYVRVYSGVLKAGESVYNAATDKKERVGRILRMHSNTREEVKELGAGDIGAVVGLKEVTTGNTLCDSNRPVLLESIEFPTPVIRVAVEPKTKDDQEKMSVALSKLAEEDPTFQVNTDEETGQTIIAGMGELHLDIIVDRLKREFKVEANVGAPQVAYRETIQQPVKKEHKYVKQTGGRGQYGHCIIEIAPQDEAGDGFEFKDEIVGGRIPKEYIPAVEKGIKNAMSRGIVAGYPMVDIKVRLIDGSYHEVDSNELAFSMAGSFAFQEAAQEAKPVLLEPIMKVETITPDEYMGDVVGDVSSRRGTVREMIDRPNSIKVIRSFIPLSEMFGYATDIRSVTQGRANYTMEMSHYDKVPQNISEQIKEKRGK